jgi:hypothetical protein
MNELEPLLREDPTHDAVRLLGSAELDVPPRDGRARLLASVGIQAGGLLGASSVAAATASASGVLLVGKWVAIGMAAGLLSSGTAALVEARVEAAAVSTPVAGTAALPREPLRQPRAPAVLPALASAAPARAAAHPRPLAATPRAVAPVSGPKPAPASNETLAAEVASLDSARRALEARDAARALAALEAHDRAFARPRLRPEATLLRLEALVAAGRHADAVRLGQRLLAADPEAAHGRRVRAILQSLTSAGAP